MWSKLVDMEMTDDEKIDAIYPLPMPQKPDYPCGLRICLTDAELDKLGLDADCDNGDVIDLRALAVVTSVYKGENSRRVELQIQKLAVENEDEEDE